MGVAPDLADRVHELELDPPDPHVDLGALAGGRAEQRWTGQGLVQIAADADALAEEHAVVQFQRRKLAEGVLGQEVRRLVAALAHRHADVFNAPALLGQEDSNAARIGRRIVFAVELHRFPSSAASRRLHGGNGTVTYGVRASPFALCRTHQFTFLRASPWGPRRRPRPPR